MIIGITLFLVGFLGIVLSLGIRAWETAHGTRVFGVWRSKGDRYVARAYRMLVFGEVPHTWRHQAVAYVRTLSHRAVNALIHVLRTAERPLARMSHRMRYTQEFGTGEKRAPSPFLKDMTPQNKRSQNGQNSV